MGRGSREGRGGVGEGVGGVMLVGGRMGGSTKKKKKKENEDGAKTDSACPQRVKSSVSANW